MSIFCGSPSEHGYMVKIGGRYLCLLDGKWLTNPPQRAWFFSDIDSAWDATKYYFMAEKGITSDTEIRSGVELLYVKKVAYVELIASAAFP